MKEKITVIIILSSVLALLFHHQSHDTATKLISVQEDLSTLSEIPLPPLELVEDELVLPADESVTIDECELNPITTNNLPFKDAFTHFRKCLGSNQVFSWKGQPYLTLLAEEVQNVEAQIADTIIVEKVNESDSEVVAR